MLGSNGGSSPTHQTERALGGGVTGGGVLALGEQNLNRLSGSRVSNSKVISRGNLRAVLPAGASIFRGQQSKYIGYSGSRSKQCPGLQSRN